jgi:ribosome recycling factor
MLHQKDEQARISVRNVREKIKTTIMDQEKNKEISEDERRRELEQLEKVVAEWNAKIDKITKEKEEEIMTV